ncbi:hypothetical protein ACQ4PT_024468 [Festuca glaucescens]
MEALTSAVIGDIFSRAISIMVEKCREQTTADEDLQRLQQQLLRISAVLEEAEGWCITNQGMIRQLSMMINQMFRGYYLLDSFKCTPKKTNDEEVSGFSFARSEFNPAKRFRRLCSYTQIDSTVVGRDSNKELKQFILVLESMVSDLKEFVIFLMSYSRMYRQPYGAYLYLEKYMFGRQLEREQAISFLLQTEHPGHGNFGVLPIVGPALVGKSTLVEHVCDDERVRNHFSLILLYRGNDLTDETATTFRDHCVIKHQSIASGEERSLVVIDLLGAVDEGLWKRLLDSKERCMTSGSKIIITSQSEKMVSFGTTEAIKLNYLSKEAYWHFFKMLVFGSTDPHEHPKLTSIAMEIALQMRGSFMFAYVIAALLRENLSARFWFRVLRHLREHLEKNTLLFGEYPDDPKSRYIWSFGETQQGSEDSKLLLLHHTYQKVPAAHGEVTGMDLLSMMDLLFWTWSAMPQGKFEVLCWRSLIPPYYSYVCSCEFVYHKEHQDRYP